MNSALWELWSLMRFWFVSFRLLCSYFQPFSLLLHKNTFWVIWWWTRCFCLILSTLQFPGIFQSVIIPLVALTAPHPSPKPSMLDRIGKLLEMKHKLVFSWKKLTETRSWNQTNNFLFVRVENKLLKNSTNRKKCHKSCGQEIPPLFPSWVTFAASGNERRSDCRVWRTTAVALIWTRQKWKSWIWADWLEGPLMKTWLNSSAAVKNMLIYFELHSSIFLNVHVSFSKSFLFGINSI